MKQEIRYNVDASLNKIVLEWIAWLTDERKYSLHTLDGYARDLSDFTFSFEKYLSVAMLEKMDVRAFRNYISEAASRGLEKSSLARHISTLRNFFKFLTVSTKIIANTVKLAIPINILKTSMVTIANATTTLTITAFITFIFSVPHFNTFKKSTKPPFLNTVSFSEKSFFDTLRLQSLSISTSLLAVSM